MKELLETDVSDMMNDNLLNRVGFKDEAETLENAISRWLSILMRRGWRINGGQRINLGHKSREYITSAVHPIYGIIEVSDNGKLKGTANADTINAIFIITSILEHEKETQNANR